MQYIFETFSSVAEFINTLASRPTCPGADNDSHTGSVRFTTTESYEAATRLALYGDRDSAGKVQTSIKKMRAGQTSSEQRAQARVRRTVVGSRPCVPAAVIGHPCSMYRRDTVHVSRPVVTVYYSISACGGVDASRLADVGARLSEAIQSVERSGVRVNLYIGNTSSAGSQTIGTFVRVKDSAKDFDLLRMAYGIVNPSFFRRHWFRWVETKPELNQSRWAGGYGRPLDSEGERNIEKEMRERAVKFDQFFTFYRIEGKTAEELAKIMLGQAKL